MGGAGEQVRRVHGRGRGTKRFLVIDGSAGNFFLPTAGESRVGAAFGMEGICTTQKQLTAASFFHSRSLWFYFLLLAKAKVAKSRTKGTLNLLPIKLG
jgi:hypothetical protein